MTTLLANKAVRRRAGAYIALLVASLILLTVSSNPLVRDVQNGVAFAFKPFLVALNNVGRDVSSIATTIAEIDRLRQENAELREDNQRLEAESRAAAELRRENEQLTGLLQLRNGLEYQTVATSVIARESSEARRVLTVDRGSDDGLGVGMVVISAGGALAGRIVDVGATFAHVALISDSTSTVIGQLLSSTATGRVIGQLGGALVISEGPAHRPRGRRDARPERGRPNGLPRAGVPARSSRVPAGHHRLRGRHHRPDRDDRAVRPDQGWDAARLGPAVRIRRAHPEQHASTLMRRTGG